MPELPQQDCVHILLYTHLQVFCIASPRKPSGSTPTCQRSVALPCGFSSLSDVSGALVPQVERRLTTMWHEARKHERKLRGMMVDYKKRAERRREYYEKIVSDYIPAWVGGPRGKGPVKARALFPQYPSRSFHCDCFLGRWRRSYGLCPL